MSWKDWGGSYSLNFGHNYSWEGETGEKKEVDLVHF